MFPGIKWWMTIPMRWIFFSLLMVNVVVFAGAQWRLLVDNGAKGSDVSHAVFQEPILASLTLLSELDSVSGEIESIRIADSDVSEDTSGVNRSQCTLVGPFTNKNKAKTFVEQLSVLGVESKVKNLLVSSSVGFWLYLPSQSSRKEVLRRLSELQRQGVDSYIIPDGDLANGISLGMFSQRSRADFLKEKIVSISV